MGKRLWKAAIVWLATKNLNGPTTKKR